MMERRVMCKCGDDVKAVKVLGGVVVRGISGVCWCMVLRWSMVVG